MQRIVQKILAHQGNLQHLIIWKRWRFLLALLLKKLRPMHSDGETWFKNTSENSNMCLKTRNYPKFCSDVDSKLVERGQYFFTLDTEEGDKMQHSCREYTMPRNQKGTRMRGWILKNTRIGPVLNIRIFYNDGRYNIEVQSLFEDYTDSWVRSVNGIDKYVTEPMLTKKEEDIASVKPIAKARPRQKEAHGKRWLPFLFLFLKGNGSTLKHNDHMITSVMKCQKSWPDCYDMMNQSLEEATKQSTTTSSSKSAGRRSSTMLRNGYLKIGYQLWQKEEERRKEFNTAWIQTLPINSCTFEAIQGHSGDNAIDPALQDNELLPKGFTEYIYHVGNASALNSSIRNGINSRRKKASREEDNLCSSLQWIRWMMNMVWEKRHAIWRNQGSLHTQILGNLQNTV